MSLNKVSLIGHVGQDPEIRSTKDGRELARILKKIGRINCELDRKWDAQHCKPITNEIDKFIINNPLVLLPLTILILLSLL